MYISIHPSISSSGSEDCNSLICWNIYEHKLKKGSFSVAVFSKLRQHIMNFKMNVRSCIQMIYKECNSTLFMLKGVHKYPQLAACTLPSSHREHCMVWGSSLSITSHLHINFINFNGLTNYLALLPNFILSKGTFIVCVWMERWKANDRQGSVPLSGVSVCFQPLSASVASVVVNCMCVHLCK